MKVLSCAFEQLKSLTIFDHGWSLWKCSAKIENEAVLQHACGVQETLRKTKKVNGGNHVCACRLRCQERKQKK